MGIKLLNGFVLLLCNNIIIITKNLFIFADFCCCFHTRSLPQFNRQKLLFPYKTTKKPKINLKEFYVVDFYIFLHKSQLQANSCLDYIFAALLVVVVVVVVVSLL